MKLYSLLVLVAFIVGCSSSKSSSPTDESDMDTQDNVDGEDSGLGDGLGSISDSEFAPTTVPVNSGGGAIRREFTLDGSIPIRIDHFGSQQFELYWDQVPLAISYQISSDAYAEVFTTGGTSLVLDNPDNDEYSWDYELSALDSEGQVIESRAFMFVERMQPSIMPLFDTAPTQVESSLVTGDASGETALARLGIVAAKGLANYLIEAGWATKFIDADLQLAELIDQTPMGVVSCPAGGSLNVISKSGTLGANDLIVSTVSAQNCSIAAVRLNGNFSRRVSNTGFADGTFAPIYQFDSLSWQEIESGNSAVATGTMQVRDSNPSRDGCPVGFGRDIDYEVVSVEIERNSVQYTLSSSSSDVYRSTSSSIPYGETACVNFENAALDGVVNIQSDEFGANPAVFSVEGYGVTNVIENEPELRRNTAQLKGNFGDGSFFSMVWKNTNGMARADLLSIEERVSIRLDAQY